MRKIRAGRYMYRGYELVRFPYHRPDHSVIWEAVCPDNGLMCVAHDYTLKALKKRVDKLIEEKKIKDYGNTIIK